MNSEKSDIPSRNQENFSRKFHHFRSSEQMVALETAQFSKMNTQLQINLEKKLICKANKEKHVQFSLSFSRDTMR